MLRIKIVTTQNFTLFQSHTNTLEIDITFETNYPDCRTQNLLSTSYIFRVYNMD